MKHISLLVSILFLTGNNIIAPAQQPAAKFDHFGDICCEDEKARLDNFVVQLQYDSHATGYVVYYGGRRRQPCGSKRSWLPKRGEAQARAARLKTYLTYNRVDGKRIVVINGGFRETWEAELWVVSPHQQPPIPAPTVKASAIKFRAGRARARDYRCEV